MAERQRESFKIDPVNTRLEPVTLLMRTEALFKKNILRAESVRVQVISNEFSFS